MVRTNQSSNQSQDANHRTMLSHHQRPLLPLATTKGHCNTITVETMVRLLDGDFDGAIDRVIVADMRYPYEYEGGHIVDAQNLFGEQGTVEKFFFTTMGSLSQDERDRTAVVFHCEFSSKRGPSGYEELRNLDRAINKKNWPTLMWPQLYVLKGGFKEFYNSVPLTRPFFEGEYVEMWDKRFRKQMKKCQMVSAYQRKKKHRFVSHSCPNPTSLRNRFV